MARRDNARISRTAGSWRVRVPGHAAQFFADSKYGGESKALSAARAWRDAHWDGRDLRAKLTEQQRAEIRRSKGNAEKVAARYGITRQRVYELRRGG